MTDKTINTEVINLNDLAHQASTLSDNNLEYLERFFSRKLTSRIEPRTSILPPQIMPSYSQSEPVAFIKYLQIESEQQWIDELKYDLDLFSKTLLSLTTNQREFLFYITSQGQFPTNLYGHTEENTVIMSTAEISQRFGHRGKELFDSLKMKNLILLNDEYDPQGDDRFITVLELYAMGMLEDVNLFSAFKGFFNHNLGGLERIFLNSDFTVLS